jgi:predicted transcriptional regulator
MTTTAEQFRKALMRQAYQDFLDWAWHKDEIMDQYLAYIEEAGMLGHAEHSFQQWVTETYWGEVE